MQAYPQTDSVRQQLEAFRFPSPMPTIRSHKIWSAQHLEPYLPSPRTLPPTDHSEPDFIDSAYSSPLEEAPPSPSNCTANGTAMSLLDTLSELESIVRKYEADNKRAGHSYHGSQAMGEDEMKSFWDDDSDDSDDDFVDEAYDSGCFTEDDESFESKLASLQPPTKRPRLDNQGATPARQPPAPGVAIIKPSASLRLSNCKRMRMKHRQVSIPRSAPAPAGVSNSSSGSFPGAGDWWVLRKPSPVFIDTFQF
ncbi:hypothetical protein DRE_05203 [Drechslerella stenobrocha 248]|uniref:Uncharacterized protein n=1 Tax=Drechslerella stenobrocha 248 TaxID=1043628 RepID=W7HZJ9_9PEZI|nr:hypothetical protein DRE_05203 [Drechslerella stenobrocha 248]